MQQQPVDSVIKDCAHWWVGSVKRLPHQPVASPSGSYSGSHWSLPLSLVATVLAAAATGSRLVRPEVPLVTAPGRHCPRRRTSGTEPRHPLDLEEVPGAI